MSTAAAIKARILEKLRELWQEIQRRNPEVPPVEFVWSTGRRRKSLEQHLHTGEWSGELAVADEQAAAGAKALVAALLHEAVHGLAAARGISVTSNNGRYHNLRFRKLAEEDFGYVVEEDYPGWGWSETTPPHEVTEAYAASKPGRELAEALAGFTAEPTRSPSTNLSVAVCACAGAAARPIRISPAKLALGPITCGVCGQDYAPRDD